MPFAQSGELRTHYELTGAPGPVLVFSNSLGTDFSMWDPQMAELAQRFRILRYDTRGHGQSTVTAGDYTTSSWGATFSDCSIRCNWTACTSAVCRWAE